MVVGRDLIPLLRVSLVPLLSLPALLTWPTGSGLLRLLHELVLSPHTIHSSVHHARIASSTHCLKAGSRPKELLPTDLSTASLVMQHGHLWRLHLLWMRGLTRMLISKVLIQPVNHSDCFPATVDAASSGPVLASRSRSTTTATELGRTTTTTSSVTILTSYEYSAVLACNGTWSDTVPSRKSAS